MDNIVTIEEIMKFYPGINREQAVKIQAAVSRHVPSLVKKKEVQKPKTLDEQIDELYGT